jgi:predicted AAA+ superfamily ATPase
MKTERYIDSVVADDLREKMVFLGGPRQCGKTTLAKNLLSKQSRVEKECYFNWDSEADRQLIIRGVLPTTPGLVVFDEIHKYTRWRNLIKGIFDKNRDDYQFLVTGSARLDLYRRNGDSLQGRYHYHRLHPLSLAELGTKSQADLQTLFVLGGFPEPFFSGSELKAKRWSREYRQRLIREDVVQLERVMELSLLERLTFRLPELVGSPLSLNSIREDLGVSQPTVARWIEILERLYLIFRVYPFGTPMVRAVKKEAKHYHFDWTLVKDLGPRFENLVACHLLKWCHWREDSFAEEVELRYFRDTDRREVDFVLMRDGKPIKLIECKTTNQEPGKHLKYLTSRLPGVEAVQISREPCREGITADGIRLLNATTFLSELV